MSSALSYVVRDEVHWYGKWSRYWATAVIVCSLLTVGQLAAGSIILARCSVAGLGCNPLYGVVQYVVNIPWLLLTLVAWLNCRSEQRMAQCVQKGLDMVPHGRLLVECVSCTGAAVVGCLASAIHFSMLLGFWRIAWIQHQIVVPTTAILRIAPKAVQDILFASMVVGVLAVGAIRVISTCPCLSRCVCVVCSITALAFIPGGFRLACGVSCSEMFWMPVYESYFAYPRSCSEAAPVILVAVGAGLVWRWLVLSRGNWNSCRVEGTEARGQRERGDRPFKGKGGGET